jgi:hypothetical protein
MREEENRGILYIAFEAIRPGWHQQLADHENKTRHENAED